MDMDREDKRKIELEDRLRDGLSGVPVPEERLHAAVEESLAELRQERRRAARRRRLFTCGSAAAVFATIFLLCVGNPALAERIPFIGNIFENLRNRTSVKGDLSANAEKLIPDELAETGESQTVKDRAEVDATTPVQSGAAGIGESGVYEQTSNGITVTVSELTCDGESLYLGMTLYSEEGFPDALVHKGQSEGDTQGYTSVNLDGASSLSFVEDRVDSGYHLEGLFDDVHTFHGIMQLPVGGYTRWPDAEQLEEAGISPENLFGEDMQSAAPNEEAFDEMERREAEYKTKVQEAFPWAGDAIEVPQQFSCDLRIRKISARLGTFHEEEKTFPDGEPVMVPVPDRAEYEGNWTFHFEVEVGKDRQAGIVEINQTNEDGVGIAAVTRTPYTVTAELILPPEALRHNYILVVCDAQGDPLETQGHSMETYSTEGRDTDKVYVYVCDYVEYLDELRSYVTEDYEEKKKEKTFAQYLSEHAKFWTEVTFETP